MQLTFDYIQTSLKTYTEASSDFDFNEHLRQFETKAKRPAGVLIPLIHRPHGINVILTKRAQHLKYHAGQVSFPGGKFEQKDKNLSRTALREAKEEIGLDPSNVVILGSCAKYETGTGFRITPYVGRILQHFSPIPQAEEVEAVFEVPIELLLQTKNYRILKTKRNNFDYTYYGLEYLTYNIWGVTAKILYRLANHLETRDNSTDLEK
ncbi:MAG: CoA pyrophosphatase [Rhodobacteraceae bacterium]|nr:CoA pyrophosphatase [Paracoccaceae bacterium]